MAMALSEGEGWHAMANYKKYLHVERLGTEECEGLLVVDLLRRAGLKTVMASFTGRLDVKSSRVNRSE